MTIRLILLAHGETDATRRASFALNESLDSRGRAAVARFPPLRGNNALTSPAAAALETAAALGLAPEVDEGLRDLQVGAWAGRALAEVAAADPAGAAAFFTDPAFAGHGGESIELLGARVAGWLDARRAARGRIVAVTHAAVVRAAVVAVLGAPCAAVWQVDVTPLAAATLTSDGRRWALRLGGDAAG